MDKKEMISQLRSAFSKPGWALMIYSGIMNMMVIAVCVGDAFIKMLSQGGNPETDLEQYLVESMTTNAWGYLIAVIIAAVAMFLWKKRDFCFRTIWVPEKGMTWSAFLQLLCLFVSGQAIFQLLATFLEWMFNLVDMSIMDSVASAAAQSSSFSMFLYMTLFAPIWEEILFRGLVLRTLEPYGRKFAILGSAFLFGIFHGNIVQSPYAFFVGLILGYTAVEYSIGWAMVLHMLNNLVLGDMFNRLRMLIPGWVGDILFLVVIWGFTLAAIIIVIVKRKKIGEFLSKGKIHPLCLKAFFTSPGVLVLTIYMVVNILFTVFAQLFV